VRATFNNTDAGSIHRLRVDFYNAVGRGSCM
jgi:hypothetical protein